MREKSFIEELRDRYVSEIDTMGVLQSVLDYLVELEKKPVKWDVARYHMGDWDTSSLDKFLGDGWEPFAADGHSIFFKRVRDAKRN